MPAGGSVVKPLTVHSPYIAAGRARDPEVAWSALRKAKRHGVGVAGVAAEAMAEVETVLRSGDVIALEFVSARGQFVSVAGEDVVAEPGSGRGSVAGGSRLVIELWDDDEAQRSTSGADLELQAPSSATARRPPIRVVRLSFEYVLLRARPQLYISI